MARKCAGAGLQLLVIDTENKFVSTGFAEEIAKAANGGWARMGCAVLHSWRGLACTPLHTRCLSIVCVPAAPPAGQYYYLPNANDAAIAMAASSAMAAARAGN